MYKGGWAPHTCEQREAGGVHKGEVVRVASRVLGPCILGRSLQFVVCCVARGAYLERVRRGLQPQGVVVQSIGAVPVLAVNARAGFGGRVPVERRLVGREVAPGSRVGQFGDVLAGSVEAEGRLGGILVPRDGAFPCGVSSVDERGPDGASDVSGAGGVAVHGALVFAGATVLDASHAQLGALLPRVGCGIYMCEQRGGGNKESVARSLT